jgi:prevent-host-death family protein
MEMSLTEDFKTIDELRDDPDGILAQVISTGRPVSIMRNGKPAIVMIDVANFERMLKTLNLVRLLGPAEEDIHAGRTQPLEEFMSEFYRANQIPRDSRHAGARRRSANSRSDSTRQKESRRKVGS